MRILLSILPLFICSLAMSQGPVPLSKKETKFMNTMFAEEAKPKELVIPVQDSAAGGADGTSDRIYLVKQQDQVLGYLLSTRAMGRYDYFDYLLAFDADISVLGLTIITYRSSHGAAICQKKWLSQFKGYSGEELRLGKEIDAVSGATISATALIQDLHRWHQVMINLKEEGHI